MRYLNDDDIRRIGIPWHALTEVIEAAAAAYGSGECAQPLKPYLRYGDVRNRIIAMPAYVTRPVRAAGMKWIASFPDNVAQGLPRAHSVTVLNDPDTGQPVLLVVGALISAIRTAAVSAAFLRALLRARARGRGKLDALVIGAGPIGRMHVRMLAGMFSTRLSRIHVFDKRPVDAAALRADSAGNAGSVSIETVDSWQDAYRTADLVVTCTTASERYIDVPPHARSILLHVSLRDYTRAALAGIGTFVVDDWAEVCRADTDIERLHLGGALRREQTVSFADVVCGAPHAAALATPILFAPMGLAAFDVAVAAWYGAQAESRNMGQKLR